MKFTAADVTVCIFTNRRSTFPHTLRSVENQTQAPRRIVVIENLSMTEAMKQAREECITPFLCKVDDDFFLHPRFLEYALQSLSSSFDHNTALYWWHLWENWSGEVIQSLKIYPMTLMWSASFSPDIQGRVDLNFLKEMKAIRAQVKSFPDIMGVHACGTPSEQECYKQIWKLQAPGRFHNKAKYPKMLAFRKSAEEQAKEAVQLIEEANRQRNTNIHRWLHE